MKYFGCLFKKFLTLKIDKNFPFNFKNYGIFFAQDKKSSMGRSDSM